MRVAVVGGGISGLSVAHFLKRAGAEVMIFEKNGTPGGTIGTRMTEGFLVEIGPSSTSETNFVIDEMLADLGMKDEKVYANDGSKYRYIVRGGELYALPGGPGSFISTRLWSARAKFRLLGEPFIGRATREESIAEFVKRRLGREFLDYAINPFVAGVYAGNPSDLSVRAAFPKLYALEEKYGGLLKGTLQGARERRRRADKAKVSAKLVSFKSGMGVLPSTIAKSLGDAVLFNTPVISVKPESACYRLGFVEKGKTSGEVFDCVVLSTPAYSAAQIIRSWLPELSEQLSSIKYPPVAVAILGYKLSQVEMDLNGFGFLVPEVEKRKILGTIWSSSIFPNRAPEGSVELTTFVGGSRQPGLASLPADEIAGIAHGENSSLMMISGEPTFNSVTRWEKAIPQYNIGHLSIVESVKHVESVYKGFYICSNYRDGISVADCIANGKRTAEKILE